MCLKFREKTGEKLQKEAERLGVSLENSQNQDGTFREAAVQARVREAKRARRESSLWIIALISSTASVISAIAAWFAVLSK